MQIKFISTQETLPLRSALLRNGWALELCRFPSDALQDTFHLGQVDAGGEVVCVLSCHRQPKAPLEGEVYQLRGMATSPGWQGKGLGKGLVEYCIQYLKKNGARGIWCNARRNAYPFYEKLGFRYMSPEFDIPEAGPHREMYLLWDPIPGTGEVSNVH